MPQAWHRVDAATESRVNAAMDTLFLEQLLTQARNRLISCSRAERRTAGGRSVALTRYVRSGPAGFLSVWLVQYPDENVVYSLTMNAPQAEEAAAAPVFQAIWESINFGARCGPARPQRLVPTFLQAALNGDRVHPAAPRHQSVIVHHGYGIACWAVNRRALDRGHGIRTGFEDVTLLPDGTEARDNAELVAAAGRLIQAHGRR